MIRENTQDVSTSVHQRLLNKARKFGRPFNELFQYFSMERFIYRLSKTPHVQKFVLANTPHSFYEVMTEIKLFLVPVSSAIAAHKSFQKKWKAPGPWK